MIKLVSKHLTIYVFTIIFAILIFFGMTTTGLNVLIHVAEKFTPGTLTVQLTKGALNREVDIQHLHYHNQSTDIDVKNIQLRLNLAALILNDAMVKKLHINQLNVITYPSNSKQATTPLTPPDIELPVKIYVNDLKIQQLQFQQAENITTVNNIHLSAEMRSNKLNIQQFKATFEQHDYDVNGQLNIKPIKLDLHFMRSQQHHVNLDAILTGSGNWQRIQLALKTKNPILSTTSATIQTPFKNLSWSLASDVKQLKIGSADSQDYDAHIDASGKAKTLKLTALLTPTDKENFSQLNLSLTSTDIAKTLFELQLNWQDLYWPKRQQAMINSPSGQLTIKGSVKNYQLNSQLLLRGHNIPATDVKVTGHGDTQNIKLTTINLKTLAGTVAGQGQLSWQTGLRYQLSLLARDLQLGKKWVNFPGEVNFDFDAKGNPKHSEFVLSNIQGELHKQDLHGYINANLKNNQFSAANVSIHAGKASLALHAKQNTDLAVKWHIHAPALQQLSPIVYGSLNSSGEFIKTKNNFLVKGELQGKRINWFDTQLSQIDTNFDFNSNPRVNSIITLSAKGFSDKKYHFDTIDLNTGGKDPKHNINLVVTNKQGSLATALQLDYNIDKNHYFAKFNKLNLSTANYGQWQLKQPFQINVDKDKLNIDGFRWHSDHQRINVDLAMQQQSLQRANIDIQQFSLATFNFALPDELKFSGVLNAKGHYEQANKKSNATLQLGLNKAKLHYTIKEKLQQLDITHASVRADIKDNILKSQLAVKLLGKDYLNLNIAAPNFSIAAIKNNQAKFSGSLHSHLSSLEFLQPLVPLADKLTGKFNADLDWNGYLLQPNLNGNASITDATMFVSEHGLSVHTMRFDLKAANNQVNYQLQAESGKGQLQITGNSYLTQNYHTDLAIKGHDFEIDNTPRFHLVISPNLKIKLKKHEIRTTGKLFIPSALINLNSYSNVVSLPSDVNIISVAGEDNEPTILQNFYANIELGLGNDIQLKSKMLNAKLAGNLRLVDVPKRETTANGELRIAEGTVTAFGQSLTINDGRLIYVGGSTTNPGLNIKATKRIKTFVNPNENSLTQNSLNNSNAVAQSVNVPLQQKIITVGVSLTGTLEQPHILLYSDQPDLSQADILSYLVLGYPLSKANGQQGEALIQAANALSSSDNEMGGIVNKIKSTLNLNEISFESSNYVNPNSNTVQQNTSLVLGKMLSPKLYVRYSIGLIVPINTLSATYSFTENWSLQTQTNSLGNGVDLLYTWETN